MKCAGFNEYGPIKLLAVRGVDAAFVSQAKVADEWEALRFHGEPDYAGAEVEYAGFRTHLENSGAQLIEFEERSGLTLDSIYVRDALIVTPAGLVLCHMGRSSRRREPAQNAAKLQELGFTKAGEIQAPGTIEGGDLIWLNERALAVL